jgi:hypothetical protein
MQRSQLVLISLPALTNAKAVAQVPTSFQPPPASAHCDLERYRARYPWPSTVDTLVMADSLDPPLRRLAAEPLEYPAAQRAAGVLGWLSWAPSLTPPDTWWQLTSWRRPTRRSKHRPFACCAGPNTSHLAPVGGRCGRFGASVSRFGFRGPELEAA